MHEKVLEYKLFVHKSHMNTKTSDYYVNFFFNEAIHGKKLSWNWSAFFFCSLWFFYRKMYFEGLFFLLLESILEFTFISFSISKFFAVDNSILQYYLILVILHTISGCYGNYLYFKRFQFISDRAPIDKNKRTLYFTKKGGFSIFSILLYCQIKVTIYMFIYTIHPL